MPARLWELEDYWNEFQGMIKPRPHSTNGWISEFGQHLAQHGDLNTLCINLAMNCFRHI